MRTDLFNRLMAGVTFAPEGVAGGASAEPVTDAGATVSESPTDAISADAGAAEPSATESAPAASESSDTNAAAEPAQTEQKTSGPEPSLLEAAETGEKGEEGAETTSQSESEKPDAEKQEGAEAKTEGEKKAEGAPEKPQPRTYEAFKLPEGAKLDDERVGQFTAILDDAELPHQERAQKLVDLHIAEMERVSKDLAQKQRDVWKEYQDRQKDDFRKDPELGGNRAETTLALAKSVVEQYGGTPEQVAETLKMLSYTGAGNNPGLIRVLNNVALLLSEGEPVTGNPPKPSTGTTRKDRWYGANGASS